jgi:hypothetical protein
MYKHTSFAITTAILLTAVVMVTLYTVNTSNAQGNATNSTGGVANNMTNSTGGVANNMTNSTGGVANNMSGGVVKDDSCGQEMNRLVC